MNASDYIYTIVEFCDKLGIDVKLHDFGLDASGRYEHATRSIRINEPNAEEALMVLAHELGHHVGYLIHGSERNRRRPQVHRERQAYVYGWHILKWFGADTIISRNRWIEVCRAAHIEFQKTGKHNGKK